MVLIKWIFSVSQIATEGFLKFQQGGLLRGLSLSGGLLRRVVRRLSLLRRVTSEGILATQVTSEGSSSLTKEGQLEA